jgi:hypothetical protein
MVKRTKRKSILTGENDADVSITFPNQHVTTREFLVTTAERGLSSITTTKHTTTTYKRQPQPVSIDPIPTRPLEEDTSPTPAGGTQVRIP